MNDRFLSIITYLLVAIFPAVFLPPSVVLAEKSHEQNRKPDGDDDKAEDIEDLRNCVFEGAIAKYINGDWTCAEDQDTNTDTLTELNCEVGQIPFVRDDGAWDCKTLSGLATLDCDEGQIAKYMNESWVCSYLQSIVFLTDGVYDGDLLTYANDNLAAGCSDGICAGDAICQAEAEANPGTVPVGTYKAWLSTYTDSPSTTFVRSPFPYVDINGVQIADGWGDLTDGALRSGISTTPSNHTLIFFRVWTGTATGGETNDETCSDWTNLSALGILGYSGADDRLWTDTEFGEPCALPGRLYCFRQ